MTFGSVGWLVLAIGVAFPAVGAWLLAFAPLPDQAVTVQVSRKEGRSKKIKVIQQPTADNDFTAIIEIHDDGGGARDYVLEIFW